MGGLQVLMDEAAPVELALVPADHPADCRASCSGSFAGCAHQEAAVGAFTAEELELVRKSSLIPGAEAMSHAACSLSGPELAICERVQNLSSKTAALMGGRRRPEQTKRKPLPGSLQAAAGVTPQPRSSQRVRLRRARGHRPPEGAARSPPSRRNSGRGAARFPA